MSTSSGRLTSSGQARNVGDGYFPARDAPAALFDEMRRPVEAAGRNPAAIEALARRGVARVAVPVSAAAGLPAQVKTPDDVLRYGKEMIARFC